LDLHNSDLIRSLRGWADLRQDRVWGRGIDTIGDGGGKGSRRSNLHCVSYSPSSSPCLARGLTAVEFAVAARVLGTWKSELLQERKGENEK